MGDKKGLRDYTNGKWYKILPIASDEAATSEDYPLTDDNTNAIESVVQQMAQHRFFGFAEHQVRQPLAQQTYKVWQNGS